MVGVVRTQQLRGDERGGYQRDGRAEPTHEQSSRARGRSALYLRGTIRWIGRPV